MLDELTSMLD